MGASESSVSTELRPLAPRRAAPWPELVDHVAGHLGRPSGGLATFERCEEQIDALSASVEAFVELCPRATAAVSCRLPVMWAQELLEQQPGLKEVRFRLVPQRMCEEVGKGEEIVHRLGEFVDVHVDFHGLGF